MRLDRQGRLDGDPRGVSPGTEAQKWQVYAQKGVPPGQDGPKADLRLNFPHWIPPRPKPAALTCCH